MMENVELDLTVLSCPRKELRRTRDRFAGEIFVCQDGCVSWAIVETSGRWWWRKTVLCCCCR
jgi:hypothetical protein